ncbi:MAG: right-handed parallel beta-helix repeat-containing protein [Chitinophagaceae bacterium]|jgi:parallel beta-helix repeat protein|nr:right-handed parallel beta-helix repeat-containing protein [Chitinophagaceae bacterium]
MKNAILLLMAMLSLVCMAQPDKQKQLQRLFVEAESSSTISLPEGTFQLDASLWLDGLNNVTIKGAGMDKTILNFSGQLSGAEGVKITNGKSIVLEDFSVQNTKGDAVKTQHVDGIVFRRVRAEWTNGPDKNNGGYGLYPVQCDNVLIEYCEARGASDAGIYVGQSNYVIVRNSKAWENVAGIEIENTSHADVYENETWNNTGGLLVFDLPDLIKKKGGHTRVFKNTIRDNNHINFAPKGNIVAKVPQGTGVMLLAANNVEVYENKITNNISAGTAIISYYMTENPIKDSTYYAYPTEIFIHHNQYERPRVRATSKGRMGKMFRFKLRFGKDVPHILYDGIVDEQNPGKICIVNNSNQSVANLKAANGFKGISRDAAPFNCNGTVVQPVQLKNISR